MRSAVLEHFVGGRDHAHVHGDLAFSAQPAHAGVLQHAQQLGLRAHRHFGDLIQQQRAVLRQLEAAGAPLHRAGERALFVTEQLALHQRFGQRRAIDGDERPVAPRAQVMNGARHQFLARAAFPVDQHRRLGGRHLPDQRENLLHGGATAHHIHQHALIGELALQAFGFFGQTALRWRRAPAEL